MAEDEDRPKRPTTHEVGTSLDTLSIQDFDERIAVLEAEIARLKVAKSQKQAALDQAGAAFKAR